MPLIERLRTEWTGFPGAPGVTTMYCLNAGVQRIEMSALLGVVAAWMPASVTMRVQTTGDVIDVASGEIRSTWSSPEEHVAQGIVPGDYAAPSGGQIRWTSDTILQGRKFVGKTFLVPLASNAYDGDGSLKAALITAVNARIVFFLAATPGNVLVYRRPRPATPQWTDVHGRVHPAKAAVVGTYAPVVSGTLTDKSVVLRSRRD